MSSASSVQHQVNVARAGVWPRHSGRHQVPQAKASPSLKVEVALTTPDRLGHSPLALEVLSPYLRPTGPQGPGCGPLAALPPWPPPGTACSKSPNFSHECLTTGAGIIQAKDPGDWVSSRDLGAEPGGRGPGSAHTSQADSPQRGGPGLGQGGGSPCLHPGVTEPQGWRPTPTQPPSEP